MRFPSLILTVLCSVASGTAQAQEPSPPVLNFAFDETVNLGTPVKVQSASGARNLEPIIGGQFAGPNIRGTIVPGGWDWQTLRGDGCFEIAADYFIKTDDGVLIKVKDTGVACQSDNGNMLPVRTRPVFEAPEGKYAWLNRRTFIGALQPSPQGSAHGVRIRIYAVN